MALADRLGVPRARGAGLLGKSSGGSFILERKRAALAAHDYRAGFFVDLARKDLGLALELAGEAGGRAPGGGGGGREGGGATIAGWGSRCASGTRTKTVTSSESSGASSPMSASPVRIVPSHSMASPSFGRPPPPLQTMAPGRGARNPTVASVPRGRLH